MDRNTLSRHDGVVAWPCITAIAESPVKAGVLWVGTDDGNVQVSRDGGKTWHNVVSHDVRARRRAGTSAASSRRYKEEGTAYVTFDNHRSADYGDLHLPDHELRRFVHPDHQRHPAGGRHGARDPRGSGECEPAVRGHGVRRCS